MTEVQREQLILVLVLACILAALVVVGVAIWGGDFTLIDFLTGPFLFLVTLGAAVPAYWWIIRGLNKSTGTDWATTKKEIFENGNVAVAVRAGCLYIAVALLVSVAILAGAK